MAQRETQGTRVPDRDRHRGRPGVGRDCRRDSVVLPAAPDGNRVDRAHDARHRPVRFSNRPGFGPVPVPDQVHQTCPLRPGPESGVGVRPAVTICIQRRQRHQLRQRRGLGAESRRPRPRRAIAQGTHILPWPVVVVVVASMFHPFL
ncbi:hypothetical protein PBRA_001099 [Plasmodiophora brassicae]|uniref:Uncharacterized protein n=1 Tax=Plasmodiophora brassicae TaxID=37360 RepID=A0A0G4IVP6_PLABS|nr:hypothetical protein PBRA_001099 [Plasmodiophora brassicae]